MLFLFQIIGILYLLAFINANNKPFVKIDIIDFTGGQIDINTDVFNVVEENSNNMQDGILLNRLVDSGVDYTTV